MKWYASAFLLLLGKERILNIHWNVSKTAVKELFWCFVLLFKGIIPRTNKIRGVLEGSKRNTGWKRLCNEHWRFPNPLGLLPSLPAPDDKRKPERMATPAELRTGLPLKTEGPCELQKECRVRPTHLPTLPAPDSPTGLCRFQLGGRLLMTSNHWPQEAKAWKSWHWGLPNQRSSTSHSDQQFPLNEPLRMNGVSSHLYFHLKFSS